MPQSGQVGGWGLVIGNFYAHGSWPGFMFQAWLDRFISILPLEYAVITATVKVAVQLVKLPELEARQPGA